MRREFSLPENLPAITLQRLDGTPATRVASLRRGSRTPGGRPRHGETTCTHRLQTKTTSPSSTVSSPTGRGDRRAQRGQQRLRHRQDRPLRLRPLQRGQPRRGRVSVAGLRRARQDPRSGRTPYRTEPERLDSLKRQASRVASPNFTLHAIRVIDHPRGRVVMLEIRRRRRACPYHDHGRAATTRAGESLVPMPTERLDANRHAAPSHRKAHSG